MSLQQYALSRHPVMLHLRNFKLTGDIQQRELWPGRVDGKVASIRVHGWLVGECVHAIADQEVSVSEHKLLLDKNACVDPFDGCHRLKAVGVLGQDIEIPTILYHHDTPKHLWFKDAFARLEVNTHCNAYSTLDLVRLVDATLTENSGKFTFDSPLSSKAAVVLEALYGASPADGSLRVTKLDINQITNLLECHQDLVASSQLDFVVKELGARDHLRAAKCCHLLLDSEFKEGDFTGEFKEDACFLAAPPRRSDRRFLPFGGRNNGIYRAKQRGEPTLLKEVFLCMYGSWIMSGGAQHAPISEWHRVSERIKRRGESPSDLEKLYELQGTAPANYDQFTLELLAAQPGLLKKAASKLNWTALLEKNLTGSRNSVVVL
jgi:hypothetical protein